MAEIACWHTGTKSQTLQFLNSCERPLKDVSDLMSEVENEDDVTDWQVAVLECRICGQRQTAVLPIGGPLSDAECLKCGNMSADVIGS